MKQQDTSTSICEKAVGTGYGPGRAQKGKLAIYCVMGGRHVLSQQTAALHMMWKDRSMPVGSRVHSLRAGTHRRLCCRGLNSRRENITSARTALGTCGPCEASGSRVILLSRAASKSSEICLICTTKPMLTHGSVHARPAPCV